APVRGCPPSLRAARNAGVRADGGSAGVAALAGGDEQAAAREDHDRAGPGDVRGGVIAAGLGEVGAGAALGPGAGGLLRTGAAALRLALVAAGLEAGRRLVAADAVAVPVQ